MTNELRNNNSYHEKKLKYNEKSYGNLKVICNGKLILRYKLKIKIVLDTIWV